MAAADIAIGDVSDTSLWVAHYRALETERPDALFHDPLARILVGERGRRIAGTMKRIGRYTAWTVVMRTVVIDRYVQEFIDEGIDTVINLGAGMDTRPYRMKLPQDLRWIEVDYPHIIAHKERLLEDHSPVCRLSRVALDLSNDTDRERFFKEVSDGCSKAVVLTEGVIPYLTEEQVAVLAGEIHGQPHFVGWIAEYMSRDVYPHMKRILRTPKMQNAPFRFFPDDWLGFFKEHGWTAKEISFHQQESLRLGRPIPMPWWAGIIMAMAGPEMVEKSKKMTGFMRLGKVS